MPKNNGVNELTLRKQTGRQRSVLIMILVLALMTASPRMVFCSDNVPNPHGVDGQSITLLWGPYLTSTDTNSTVINVKTDIDSTVIVYFATEEYYAAYHTYNMKASDGTKGQLHHIDLSGLVPGTVYLYQVNYNGEATGEFSFATFPAAGKFTFAVYGDTQDELPNFSQAERHKLVADRIAQEEEVLFVLNVGDLVNDGNDAANWDRYFNAARNMVATKTVFPARGNHDGNDLYYDIFGVLPYYSFDCADAHFTILDSIDNPIGQTDWLYNDLANEKEWKFVFSHHPIYTSETNHFGGWENFRNEWENIFISQGVDVVWNGHIHAYERYLENNIMYMVVGIGGGPYSTLSTDKYPGYRNSLERSLGYAKVTIDPDAGTALVQVVRVADISMDGKIITELPEGTIFETYTVTSSAAEDLKITPIGSTVLQSLFQFFNSIYYLLLKGV